MKSKILCLSVVSILLLTILASFISAGIDYLNSAGTTIASVSQTIQAGNTVTVSFKLKEDNHGQLADMSFNTPITLVSGTNSLVSASTVTGMITSLDQAQTSGLMSLTFTIPSTQTAGTYTGNLILTGIYIDQVTYTLPISITVTEIPKPFNFCEFEDGVSGNPGDLSVAIKDINVLSGLGKDKTWYPFDEVEVKVDVKDRGSNDVNNIVTEWGLYDKKSEQWVIEMTDLNDFDLNNGKTKSLTFQFKLDDSMDVDLVDLNDGSNYIIYIRATGEVDDVNNSDTCVSDSDTGELIIDNNFVVLNNFEIPENISCGSDLVISADLWNIGSEDQDDVSVKITNTELGISQTVDIGTIDSFDNQNLDVTIKIPKNAAEKSYSLTFQVFDEDGDIFTTSYDSKDIDSKYTKSISVSGSCSATIPAKKALVSANLVSGGKAGQDLVVKVTVTNTGDKAASFILNAADYTAWADSATIEPKTLTIDAGKSADALITLKVKTDAIGDNLFKIELAADNQLVSSQPVSVTIEKSTFSLSDTFGSNWYLWLLGIINVILVIVIIIIAVRVSRK